MEELSKSEKEKRVTLQPELRFPSKQTPHYESDIKDADSGEEVGVVAFVVNNRRKIMQIDTITILQKKEGYGVATYRAIQNLHPDFVLQSSSQMVKKDDPNQEKPNAVYLWEKLVKLGFAEKGGDGVFRMKKAQQT